MTPRTSARDLAELLPPAKRVHVLALVELADELRRIADALDRLAPPPKDGES